MGIDIDKVPDIDTLKSEYYTAQQMLDKGFADEAMEAINKAIKIAVNNQDSYLELTKEE